MTAGPLTSIVILTWNGISDGIIGGFVVLGVIEANRFRRQRRDFGGLQGEYDARLGHLPVVAEITPKRNRLEVKYRGLPDGDSVEGTVLMNEQLPEQGRGPYKHKKGGSALSGWWDVYVEVPNTTLVVTTRYVNERYAEVPSRDTWTRRVTGV